MGCSVPGFPVPQHLPEFVQVHIHWISDAIQPSHPLLPSSPPSINLSQHQGLFQSINPWPTPQFPHPLRLVWTPDFCDDGCYLHSDMKHSHLSATLQHLGCDWQEPQLEGRRGGLDGVQHSTSHSSSLLSRLYGWTTPSWDKVCSRGCYLLRVSLVV